MVFTRERVLRGEKRYYLESSFRLPNGKVKKVSLLLKNPREKEEKEEEIKEKVKCAQIIFAVNFYKKDSIFTEETIKKIEEIRLNYNEIRKKLSKNQLQDVLDRFAVNFTYESNAIEGSSLTLKDVAIIIYEKIAVKGKDLREIYETTNTRDAFELIFKNQLDINEQDIIKLHKILTKNTGINEGYKTIPNFLLGRKTKTTPPEKVKKEMNKIIKEYWNNTKIHPLQRAALFHGKFERIHPFEDGNGRVGRLLINIILLKNGYPPLIMRKTQREKYFHALEACDNNSCMKMYYFLIEKYKDTYHKFFEVYMHYLPKK